MNNMTLMAMRKIAKAGDKLPNGGVVMFDPKDNPEQYLRELQIMGRRILTRKYNRFQNIQQRIDPYEKGRLDPFLSSNYYYRPDGSPSPHQAMYNKLKDQRQRVLDDFWRFRNVLNRKIGGTPDDMIGRRYIDTHLK